jgi:hypothetical protein
MNRIISSLLVVAALAVPALAAADVHVYTRVNQVGTDFTNDWSPEPGTTLDIAGVRADGERSYSYRSGSSSESRDTRTLETCQRYAALAIAKPGRYSFEVRFVRSNETYGYLKGCTLRRVEPEAGR